MYRGQNLFALRVKGDSMKDVGILPSDLVICEPRQYAQNGEIVVALINNEEATVKHFFLRKNHHIELRPENRAYPLMRYGFVEEFPMTVTGKLQKFRMQKIAIEKRKKGADNSLRLS